MVEPVLWKWLLAYGILGLALWFITFGGIRSRKRQRLIQNIPTSKTAGVFIDLVEVQGTAESDSPITSELAKARCVHYSFSVQEHWSRRVTETYRGSGGKARTRTRTESGWKTIESGGHEIPFYLKDDSGLLRIVPAKAKVEPMTLFSEKVRRSDPLYYSRGHHFAVSNSTHKRRFLESGIPMHHDVYVIGQSREREDIAAAEIAHDETVKMFIISTRPEEKIQKSFRNGFWGFIIFGLLVSIGGPWLLQDILIHAQSFPLLSSGITVGVYLIQLIARWSLMVFNDPVDLKNRVFQASANIDVQLKRRQDLIPRLVKVVSGLKDYESKLQSHLVKLRAQSNTTVKTKGTKPSECSSSITAIAEAYPEMKSDDTFLKLQKKLSDTEERIALARNYYNDIVTHYNTRRETIPDRYFASIAGLKHIDLFVAEDFRRATVKVELVD